MRKLEIKRIKSRNSRLFKRSYKDSARQLRHSASDSLQTRTRSIFREKLLKRDMRVSESTLDVSRTC